MEVRRTEISGIRPSDGPTPAGASQDFEDFIYLISHDVRSSVRALLELPQWIVEDLEQDGVEVKGKLADSIDLMNRHTGRLDRMLVDLLTFSRVGRMQRCEKVKLSEALAQVLEAMKLPSGFEVVSQLGECSAVVGERDILTLFDALIQNAVKHHDRDAGRIIVTAHDVAGGVEIRVADDGPGILDEFSERVFSAMTTLKPRDEVEGSGMGLASVRKIARLYGGDAWVLPSPYGRGTQFSVSLMQNAQNAG